MFGYLISLTLSDLQTRNDSQTGMTRNLQTDWVIACNPQTDCLSSQARILESHNFRSIYYALGWMICTELVANIICLCQVVFCLLQLFNILSYLFLSIALTLNTFDDGKKKFILRYTAPAVFLLNLTCHLFLTSLVFYSL